MKAVKLTGAACRAARGLLSWSQRDLVRAAGTSHRTVVKVEADDVVHPDTEAKVIATFAAHGVEILNGDAPGARMRKASAPPQLDNVPGDQ